MKMSFNEFQFVAIYNVRDTQSGYTEYKEAKIKKFSHATTKSCEKNQSKEEAVYLECEIKFLIV